MQLSNRRIFGVSLVTITMALNVIGIALVAAFLTLATGCARSRDMAAGDMVRVDFDDARADGRITSLDNSTLHISSGGKEAVAVELQSIRSIERYRGKANHGPAGLVLGSLAGTAVGMAVWADEVIDYTVGAIGVAFGGPEPEEPNDERVLIGTAIGGVVGFLIGYSINYERWERVHLEKYGVEVKPTRDGGRAAVFWEF